MDEDASPLTRIEQKIDRLQATMDRLLAAIVDDVDEQPGSTLDGDPEGKERDQNQSLG